MRIVPTTRLRAGFACSYQRWVAGAENSRATLRCQAVDATTIRATAAALTPAGSPGGSVAVRTLPKNAAAFGLVRLLTTPWRNALPRASGGADSGARARSHSRIPSQAR